MRNGELVSLHPSVFHMAEPTAFESIMRWGLLSTAALCDALGMEPDERASVVRAIRRESIVRTHRELGTVVIRDNKPMNYSMLRQAVREISPEDYLELVNSRVFFWPSESRLERFLTVYGRRPQLILQLDTASLLASHRQEVTLSPINSGAVRMVSHVRGPFTFSPLVNLNFDEWRGNRSARDAVAEICVDHSVPYVTNHLIDAHIRNPDGSSDPLTWASLA